MDAPARFRHRDALHAVAARLKLEPGPGPLALDDHADLLDAAELRLADVDDLELPALSLGVHAVHAVEVRREEHPLFPADAAADLHDDVLLIVRVLRQQQDLDLLLQPLPFRPGRLKLLLGKGAHLRIFHQFLRSRHIGLRALPGLIGRGQRLQLPRLPLTAGVELRIGIGLRLLHAAQQFLILIFKPLQPVKHRSLRSL